MILNYNLLSQIYFFNIGKYQANDSYFNWTTNNYYKSNVFDIKMTRSPPAENIFYCIPKADIKLVYFLKDDVVYTIGSDPQIQSQLLEAILEHLIEEFADMYDKSLLMSCYGDVCNIFDGFISVVENKLKNFNSLNLFKTALVTCKACKKTIPIVIKKSVVENSTKSTVPIVYIHVGHALLVYVDKNYKVRGNELVAISY
ncbi:MAG: hypothetical protein ACFFAO_10190 [Candidatus Hermodarchaeota archaeon]